MKGGYMRMKAIIIDVIALVIDIFDFTKIKLLDISEMLLEIM